MPELTDHELLAEFARSESEEAFATLVERHVNLVYSSALRFTGNSHQAEEITQAVFIILARKAGKLSPRVVLSGWLYQTVRLTAANFLKGEIRRQRREQEAYMQSTLTEPDTETWQQIKPLLDDAMGRLGEADRNAVVLRFFENKTAAEVASALKLSEAAAHKRTSRALDKLRKFFSRRGVSSTSAIIAGTISAHSVHAAPATLAKSVSIAAIAKGAAASGSILTLVKGALKIMAWTKAKTAVVVGVVALLVAGTTTVAIREIQEHRTYPWEVPQWRAEILNKVPPQVRIVPAKFPAGGMGILGDGKMMGIGQPLSSIFPHAFRMNWARTLCKFQLPSGRYDFIANLPEGSAEALGREIERKFGLKVTRETLPTDVLLLTVRSTDMPGLKPAGSGPTQLNEDSGRFLGRNTPLVNFSSFLESCFHIPVIDRTGLSRNFDIDLKWDEHDEQETLREALLNQLGLELVPTNTPIEMLVVEKGH